MSNISKKISWLLRHGAGEEGLTMDEAGWVTTTDLLEHLEISKRSLDSVVKSNDKSRFQVKDDHIRAVQGHSIAGMPITLEGLESSWTIYDGDDIVWHGTGSRAIEGIASQGILPIARTHVHMADSRNSTVGKRSNVAVMLGISVSMLRDLRIEVFKSENGVVLSRSVPTTCIVSLHALSRRARRDAHDLRKLLGLKEASDEV